LKNVILELLIYGRDKKKFKDASAFISS